MSDIKIPFRPFFREPMLAGQKTMTSRTKAMGKPGDRFEAFGAVFELTHVFRVPLKYVLSDCFEQEGCKSVQELMDIWNNIHPVTGIMPDQIVYAHIFQMVQL